MASSLDGTLPYETDSLYEDLEFVIPYGEYPGLEEEEKYEPSYFEYVELAPYNEVLALIDACDMDPDPDKINLSIESKSIGGAVICAYRYLSENLQIPERLMT